MPGLYTEADYENSVIELFRNDLGYEYAYGPDIERDFYSPLYEEILIDSLYRLNRELPDDAIQDALFKLKNFENGELVQKNTVFMDYLQNGIPVRYLVGGEERSSIVYLVDYKNPDNNSFIVANQWTFIENSNKRPDVILFLNGLPVVLVELKSPSREETDASEAYRQLRNYMQEIPSMFVYNAICVMSDQLTSKAGTITSGEDRFMEWKTKDGDYENTQYAQFDTFFEGMFQKKRLLDIIKNFICFSNEGINSFKILAGYHQYFAVRKAIESTKHATVTDGKGGVFWHTQGSGKSFSMVFYAHLLQQALDSPTIVVITDRNDLDDQLYGQFAKCKDFLRQEPMHAESRENLKNLLDGRKANGIIFTTMQKFEESHEPLSERHNIVVMADEAHRGQYGLTETVDAKTGKVKIGTARIIRNTLPNATYIGFTGTPISSKDRSTREVFGDYIDIYDMTQAVEDGATRPVYYESRVIKLNLDEATLKMIDAEYDIMAENADNEVIEKSKRELGQMEAVLGNDNTINSLVCDILDHYENNRENLLTGKAMIVAYSRPIAMKIYKRILELRPAWTEKVAVVMTSGNNDPEEWREIIGNKHHKNELAKKFKDNNSPLKIAIVVDMWLTGFDVPSLATMYVYKPMSGHNLMQAIARVNRVFRDKEGGLVVDYVGIATALKQAMNDYTSRDKKNYGDTDVAKVAYPKFLEKLSVCRDKFHGYDYSKFQNGTDLERAKTISGAVNFIMGREKVDEKDSFVKEALMLHQALSLCSSLVDEDSRFEAAFFESVRVLVLRLTNAGVGKKISLPEMNARINELLKQSIKSDGVINLFSDIKEEFSLFDPKFLQEVANMKEKNLAVELLKKLIAEQVSVYRRTNVVKSEKFSEIMQRSINAYLNGMLTNEEVIEEMLKLAKQIAAAQKEGDKLGLTADELAFYDALTKPQAIKDFYENDELIAITKELADTLRKNKTIDWQKRESARAKMRMLIKKLLKKHKYPPEGMEDAVQTVMTQCELWTDNVMDA
ncbi:MULTISPECIES: type I restriction endonuclease subunit R [Lachnospiraceae]|mgnify:CR=1 FL=1|uniref:type I restriction endonuclease subunit R n=1 Tax=Lachnospiraceae TaxID=186803 RepID=UPI001D0676B5|nr:MULTISPECIES: type I restriction endonuclease subunit R [Lachnospiraceae]MCC3184056.1 type I restriction endonuclease subunit R [[Clostridium] innocuum]MCB6283077.1 type I restriction endonuclease subunit R [Dorea formicigenerans]MCB6392115.1 type I restriction endonuclease subunit R [Dorea formicigenerans]MCB6393652.1 type I restriction endonuclease subunit R [Dorea formicigenerans]MCB6411544.1 type I restriction endonuclease subunit R [Dorea formicigenerans]